MHKRSFVFENCVKGSTIKKGLLIKLSPGLYFLTNVKLNIVTTIFWDEPHESLNYF